MKRGKQAETIPDLLPESTEATDNKANAGAVKSGDPLYTGYNNVYEDFCVVVVGLSNNGKPSKPIVPDFDPRDLKTKTTHNRASGSGGALQAMQSRAALFAKHPRIVQAFVRRERDGQLWQVDAGGYITEMKDTVKI